MDKVFICSLELYNSNKGLAAFNLDFLNYSLTITAWKDYQKFKYVKQGNYKFINIGFVTLFLKKYND